MNNYKIAPLVLIAAGLAGACGNKQQQQAAGPQAIPVTTDVVTEEIVAGMDGYPGGAVPLNETDLRAGGSGSITCTVVGGGANVNQGQKVNEIERTRYEAAAGH